MRFGGASLTLQSTSTAPFGRDAIDAPTLPPVKKPEPTFRALVAVGTVNLSA
jgi:hypothetical protein